MLDLVLDMARGLAGASGSAGNVEKFVGGELFPLISPSIAQKVTAYMHPGDKSFILKTVITYKFIISIPPGDAQSIQIINLIHPKSNLRSLPNTHTCTKVRNL